MPQPDVRLVRRLATAKGSKSKVLGRATPTVVNTGYNSIQMWDGRKSSLEDQAMGPMESMDEMAMDLKALFAWLAKTPGYKAAFRKSLSRRGDRPQDGGESAGGLRAHRRQQRLPVRSLAAR